MIFQRLADGIGAVAGAASLSQFPAFYVQYVQRLGGRLDQASVQRDRILAAARDHAITAGEYVRRLLDNADSVVRSEGHNASAALADADRLRAVHDALANAALLDRPLVFVRNFDAELARATFDRFVPAVPLSPEGLAYAAIGMVLGLILVAVAEWALVSPFRTRRRAGWRGR